MLITAADCENDKRAAQKNLCLWEEENLPQNLQLASRRYSAAQSLCMDRKVPFLPSPVLMRGVVMPPPSLSKKKKTFFFLPFGTAFTKTCAGKCSCLAGVSPAWEKEAVEEKFGEKHLKSQDNTPPSTSGSTGMVPRGQGLRFLASYRGIVPL